MADFSALKSTIQTYIKQNGNEEITGSILQEILLAMVQTMGDSAINGLVSSLSNEATTRANADTTLSNGITAINNAIQNGYVYAGIATPTGTPASGKVFYVAIQAGTYTHFGGLTVAYGINILKYNGSVWSLDVIMGIDAEPTAGSVKPVQSGGVFDEIVSAGVYDVSAKNSGETFASLAALLSDEDLNTLIPTAVRKGGMTIRFVQTYDNSYAQYRYMSSSTAVADFTNIANWQGVDKEAIPASKNLIESGSIVDSINSAISNVRNGKEKNFATNCYWSIDDTNINAEGWAKSLDYIKVYPGETLHWTPGAYGSAFIIICDANKVKIDAKGANAPERDLVMPNNAAYVKISYNMMYNGQPNTTPLKRNGVSIWSAEDAWNGLGNKLDKTQQSLTSAEKKQVRQNLGFGNGDIDNTPFKDSDNVVKSGGVYQALEEKEYETINIVNDGQEKNHVSRKCLLNNGTEYSDNNWNYNSDFIEVAYNETLIWNYGSQFNSASLVLYNANKEVIDFRAAKFIEGTRAVLLDNENVKYVRASFDNSVTDILIRNGQVILKKKDKVIGFNQLDQKIEKVEGEIYPKLRAGSGSNAGNTIALTTAVYPIYGSLERIALVTNRPNSANCEYRYGYVLTSSKADIGSLAARVSLQGVISYSDFTYKGAFDLHQYKGIAVGINITIAELNTTTGEWNPLTLADFDGYTVKIVDTSYQDVIVFPNINNDVVARNNSKHSLLCNACRQNKDSNNSKNYQMLIITDTHEETLAVKNAVIMTNGFDTIDCMIHCGDISATTYDPSYFSAFFSEMLKCNKPWLIVPGNHDVGNTMSVFYGATHKEVYTSLIKPMVDANILVSGEYTQNVPYYYHDFSGRKIRVIVIYEYEAPLDVAENEYWEEVTYDSSYAQMETGTTYTYDANNSTILNCGGYTGGSFRLKKTVTTVAGQYSDSGTMPTYKVARADRVIMQDQAQWLVNTLLSTPADYGIIIATHNPSMMDSSNQTTKMFAQKVNRTGAQSGQFSMVTDLLSEIVNAYINKTNLSLKVIMGASGWHGSSATYLNTLNDGGTDYCYEITADFSNRNNSYFAGYVAGHVHQDLVFKHNTYPGQYCIAPLCGTTSYANSENCDVARPYNRDGQSYDAITVISVKKDRIALVRLGNDRTVNGDLRDFEVINTAE